MKKIYLVVLVLLAAVTSKAQAPQKFSYQAVIRNNSNVLISNQAVSERISLVKDSAMGTVVYSEKQNVKTNANGLVSLQIGTGSVVSGSFSSINWGASNYFIKIETDPNGGNNYTINTTTQLLSVPYALYAANGGTPGPQGIQGPKGDSGARGLQGIQGIQGLKEDKGDQGVQGLQGLTGATGIQGPKGDSGARGLQGIQGVQGLKGDQGIQGLTGATGAKGDSGARGLQGIQGIQGLKGTTGAKGDSGVSVRNTVVTGDSLYVMLSTGQKVNAGNVRGLKGAGFQNGTALGQILYWNGNIWDTIKVGKRGQFLQLNSNNLPQWAGLTYPTIKTLPATSISYKNAVLKGVIVNGGGIGIDSVSTSFLISTTSNAPISSCKLITSFQRNADTFYVDLLSAGDSLLSKTTYYIRASGYNNQYNDASGGNTIGNEVSFTTSKTLAIGDTAYGGIIFYIDSTGKHGLVCATNDQSTGAVWGNYPKQIGATGTAIGTGAANTTQIIAVLGNNGAAASLCRNYRGGGFSDWFLPSKDELNELYKNGAVVGGLALGYWSSSEYSPINGTSSAWTQNFVQIYGGYQYLVLIYNTSCVRAVRAF